MAANSVGEALCTAPEEYGESVRDWVKSRTIDLISSLGFPADTAKRRALHEHPATDPNQILEGETSVPHPLASGGPGIGVFGVMTGPPPARILTGVVFEAEQYPGTPPVSHQDSVSATDAQLLAVAISIRVLADSIDSFSSEVGVAVDWVCNVPGTDLPDESIWTLRPGGVLSACFRLGRSRYYYSSTEALVSAWYETPTFDSIEQAKGFERLVSGFDSVSVSPPETNVNPDLDTQIPAEGDGAVD